MSKDEIWKDVVGFEGFYKVSNKGNVRSVARIDSAGRKRRGITLKPANTKDGYFQVILCKNGATKSRLVHRLVLEAFVPNPNNYPEVNHRNEIKTNNYVENLEWCTREYNMNFGTATKRIGQTLSKKVKAINVKTGEIVTFGSTMEAKSKGYSNGKVSEASRGVYKDKKGNLIGDGHTYKGHKWSYE